MANDFFNASGVPAIRSPGSSAAIKNEFANIALAFDKMPTLTGKALKVVIVDATATKLDVATVTLDTLPYLPIAGGTVTGPTTFNSTLGVVGAVALTAGLTVGGAAALNGGVTLGDAAGDGLTVNSNVATIPNGITFSGGNVTVSSGLTVSGATALNGGVTLGDAAGDALTITSSVATIPNGINLTGGNVGLGVVPTTKLDVNGTITVRGNIGAASSAAAYTLGSDPSFTNGGMLQVWGSAAGTPNLVVAFTAGTERLRIDAAGKVGIGAVPTYSLDVHGIDGQLRLNNTTAGSVFQRLAILGTDYGYLGIAGANAALINNSIAGDFIVRSTGGGIRFSIDNGTSTAFNIDSSGTAFYGGIEVGYRTVPRIDQNGGSPAASLVGKAQGLTGTSNYTVNTGVFTAGSCFSVVNFNNANVTIVQGSGMTMHLAGTATTGNRTLGPFGMATFWFANGAECWISGAGVS